MMITFLSIQLIIGVVLRAGKQCQVDYWACRYGIPCSNLERKETITNGKLAIMSKDLITYNTIKACLAEAHWHEKRYFVMRITLFITQAENIIVIMLGLPILPKTK